MTGSSPGGAEEEEEVEADDDGEEEDNCEEEEEEAEFPTQRSNVTWMAPRPLPSVPGEVERQAWRSWMSCGLIFLSTSS